jgi:hypothetical protein
MRLKRMMKKQMELFKAGSDFLKAGSVAHKTEIEL